MVNTEVAGPAMKPSSHTISLSTVPINAPLGKAITSSKAPPKISPNEPVAFTAKERAAKITPSRRYPVSSSCSSAISANIEFKVAKIMGANAAVTKPLTMSNASSASLPLSGNQATPVSDNTIGILILTITTNAETINVIFLSSQRVMGGNSRTDKQRPTNCAKGIHRNCSVVNPQKWNPIKGLNTPSTASTIVLNIMPKKIARKDRFANAALNSANSSLKCIRFSGKASLRATNRGTSRQVPRTQTKIETIITAPAERAQGW